MEIAKRKTLETTNKKLQEDQEKLEKNKKELNETIKNLQEKLALNQNIIEKFEIKLKENFNVISEL